MTDRPFLLEVENVYTNERRRTVVTGKIEQGTVRTGDKAEVLGLGGSIETVVTSVEAFHRPQESATAGENVGLLLRGIKSDQVERGQVVAAPRSINLTTSSTVMSVP